jgi:amylosucrase
LFGRNDRTGDARISGALASLVGLEAAVQENDEKAIDDAIRLILLLHGVILSFGGIPLLNYGDELGTTNDYSVLDDPKKGGDSRWIHRPRIDWNKAERRHQRGTIEQRIFDGLRKLIAIRKSVSAFADFNNRELLTIDNLCLFAFLRSNPTLGGDNVLVVANFNNEPQHLDLGNLGNRGQFQLGRLHDLASGESPVLFKDQLVVPPYRFYWLTDQGPSAAS